MNDDQLNPQLEKILKEIKLKEPKQPDMADYLSKVRSKIELKQNQSHFHFVPAAGLAFALILALCGAVYFLVNQTKSPQPQIVSKISEPAAQTASNQDLSLEEEMAILEAFSEDYPAGTSDLLGDEAAAEDLVLLDEIEFTITPAVQGTFSS